MKCLVTGAGGFLGGAIAKQLIARGESVRNLSRSSYPHLEEMGVEQVSGNIADYETVKAAVTGVDIVFHVAAKAGAWGTKKAFYDANVVGTENILKACKEVGVKTLVYTSSPSVVFNGQDMEGVDESVPYPDAYDALYPETKAAAEKLVLAANGDDLATVSLRPHLIWGPGDTNLVPRIVDRGKKGQLRIIGKEKKLVDTVYIDDAAKAHLLAADKLMDKDGRAAVGGKAYFITSDAPIETWTMINRILGAADIPPLTKTVPKGVAVAAGWTMEMVWGAFGLKGEPRMTRWVAHELATAHWFDISAAKNDLGYTPEVDLETGMSRLRAWIQEGGLEH